MTKEFKKVFLYREDKQIQKILSEYEEWAAYLQQALEEAQKLFDEPLKPEEQIQVLREGWKGVEYLVRSKSDYPKADLQTLMNLMGKGDLVPEVQEALRFAPSRFAAVGYHIEKGKVTVQKDALKKLQDERSYYTRSAEQSEAYNLAEKISDLIEEAIEKGYISKFSRQGAANSLQEIVISDLDPKSKQIRLLPNVKRIAKI